MLSLSDEAKEALRQFATTFSSQTIEAPTQFEVKTLAATAKIQRNLDAARHLYEEGAISREDSLLRKPTQKADLARGQNYMAEVRQPHVELMLCAEALNRLTGLWEGATDEGRQLLALGLFEAIVFDLDEQRTTDFKLKALAERLLVVRGMQLGGDGTALPPAGNDPSFEPAVIWALLEEIYLGQLTRSAAIRRRNEVAVRIVERGASKSEIGRVFGISPRRVGQVLMEKESESKLATPLEC
jgi:hypothetical protein